MIIREGYMSAELVKHCDDVTQIALFIANKLSLSEYYKTLLKEAALVHDIGMYYIPEKILSVKRPLLPIERIVVGYHSTWGYLTLRELGVDESICQLVLTHHGLRESPKGVGLEDSTLFLYEILVAADIYSAMTSKREYRDAVSHEDAMYVVSEKMQYSNNILEILNSINIEMLRSA